MPYSQIQGFKIYYEIHGQGEPVVLLHHGFASSKMWTTILKGIVKKGYQVLIYDRRGYGKSEPGSDFNEFYISDDFRSFMIKELDRLTEKLGFNSFHLVGQCEGGVLACDFASSYPNKSKSLVIAGAQCYSYTDMITFCREKFPLPFSRMDRKFKEKFQKWHGHKRAEDFYNHIRIRGGAYGSEYFDLRPVLTKVACPSLVLYPDRSKLFPVEQAISLYRNLAKGQLAILPLCGHNTYEQSPGDYLKLVLDFLSQNSFSSLT